jgi:hypothetical protein
VGGAGSEYVPMEEDTEEEAPNNFVEETDPEIQSNSVIEEEFVLHDLDMELKEQEIRSFSQAESNLQVEAESEERMATVPDSEMESQKRMEKEWEELHQYNTQEELININETAGGGSEFLQMEMSEEDADREQPLELVSEAASVFTLENDQKKEEPLQVAAADDFRITEEVKSPGAFLPEKSHTFLEWLQFFRPETPVKKKVTMEKVEMPVTPDENKTVFEAQPLSEPVPSRSGMKDELEAIDRIVSSLQHDQANRPAQFYSPEQMARKSLQMDDDIASETLAQIYEGQGKIDKAIRMYARLSLKFPEKSLFFAARIKELKSK